MAKDAETPADIRKEFWNRAEDVTAGMLSSDGAPARPMAHIAKPEDNALWFITAQGTDIEEVARAGKTGNYILACSHGQLYASIEGQMTLEQSQEKLDEIWSPMASVWFEDGREDPDVRLVRFTPQQGEVWTTDGSAKAMYEIAKSFVNDDDRPDLGAHGKVTF